MSTSFDSIQLPTISYQNIVNIIDNGGFDNWQRGTTFTNPASVYTADRWFVANAGGAATSTITKETSVTDNTAAALKWNITSNAGNGQAYLLQYIEDFKAYRGKTLTVTIRSQQSVSGFLLGIYDGVTATTTPLGSNGGYTTYSLTVTISSSCSTLFIFWGNNGTPIPVGTFYLDSVMLSIGSSIVPFVPTNPQVDLARCQRYFQVIGGGVTYLATGQNESTTRTDFAIPLIVQMRIPPTITVNNPTNFSVSQAGGGLVACTVVSSSAQTVTNSIYTQTQVASGLIAGNAANFFCNNANATIFLSADL